MVLNLCEYFSGLRGDIDREKQSQVAPLIIEVTVYQVLGKLVKRYLKVIAHERLYVGQD